MPRQGRFRLPAESIRDSALAVSGLLYPKVGGRSFRPPQPEGANRMDGGSQRWKVSEGPDLYRRGLYIQHQRMAPYPLLTNFDMPAGYEAACRRDRSNSPLLRRKRRRDWMAAKSVSVIFYVEPLSG